MNIIPAKEKRLSIPILKNIPVPKIQEENTNL